MNTPRLRPEAFTLALAVTVGIASLLPCSGSAASGVSIGTQIAVTVLFFLHGARLSREAVRGGLMHWRLHVLVLLGTFVMFPLLGLALRPLRLALLTPPLDTGFLFLCAVPSTVQSSIALTAMARGNVAAAVCSASLSSLLGAVLTPALVGAMGLASGQDKSSASAIVLPIASQLLLPFIAGQLLRPRIVTWVDRYRTGLRFLDQATILLVVYSAFSAATTQGLWHQLPWRVLAGLVPLTVLLLACALLITWQSSRLLGFNREDQIAVVFCGSKKSLASGVPIANVVFPTHVVGAAVLPLMLFHQLQLMVCAVIAQRCAARSTAAVLVTERRLT